MEALFSAARREAPMPTVDLVARMLKDAQTAQPAAPVLAAPEEPQGLWSLVVQAIGGWPSVAGLATATVAGIWIGVSPPAAVDALAYDYLEGSDSYFTEIVPSYDSFFEEG